MALSKKKLGAAILTIAVIGVIAAVWRVSGDKSEPAVIQTQAAAAPVQQEGASSAAPMHEPTRSAPAPSIASTQASAADFRKNQACYQAAAEVDAIREAVIACESLAGVKEAETSYKQCRERVSGLEVQQQKLSPILSQCQGTESEMVAAYMASTKAAARQGDPDAQLCYLQSAFGTGPRHTDQDVRDFDRDAPRYIRLALQRGDWRIVELLGTRRFTPASGLLPRIVKGDLQTQYQMNRLARLGASGEYAKLLDLDVQHDLLSTERKGTDALTPQQVAEAERRAREMYSKYFAGTAPLTERPIPCKATWQQ